jgi:hypothetical protein
MAPLHSRIARSTQAAGDRRIFSTPCRKKFGVASNRSIADSTRSEIGAKSVRKSANIPKIASPV